MSASPAGQTPGRTPNGVNHAPRPRPRPPVDPLVKPKRRPIRPNLKEQGTRKPIAVPDRPRYDQVAKLTHSSASTFDARGGLDLVPSGFSSAPVSEQVRDYPLVITKQALEGLRHHVAKFFAKKPVDPRDENEFTRPVRLQRRDARAPAPGETQNETNAYSEDPEERRRREAEKQERSAKRDIELSQIAPGGPTVNKRADTTKKKTERVWRHDQTQDKKAASQLRYEEALQWHLEDFDNKQSWVGNYEAALSGTYAHMALKDGKFRLTPVEKWYRFTPKMHIKPMELEEAEKKLKEEPKEPAWLTRQREQAKLRREEALNRIANRKLHTGKKKNQPEDDAKQDAAAVDELDFEEDRFADDEENDLFEGDLDEVKDNTEKIKKDMLQANIFDLKDEKTYEVAEKEEKAAKMEEKRHGKRVKKALMKREKNRIYDSDSDHPYSSASESTDSEAERAEQDQAKKEAEEKTKGGSGNSSKNNTPSKSKSLKRAGSTNASDVSGNESARKKQKKQHSRLGTGANTPNGTVSRSGSPGLASSQEAPLKKLPLARAGDSLKRPRPGAGSGSEGEGAGSGGEMSDGTRKKIKIVSKTASTNASPGGSRAGSVERDPGRPRVLSPDALSAPGEAQIKAAIPADGITLVDLMNKLGKHHFQGARKEEVFKVVRMVSKYDKTTKMLKLLPPKK